MKSDLKLNGYPYHKYMLCYVDDLFHIGFNTKEDMGALNIIHWLKGGFVPPDLYLGVNVDKVHLEDRRVVWLYSKVMAWIAVK